MSEKDPTQIHKLIDKIGGERRKLADDRRRGQRTPEEKTEVAALEELSEHLGMSEIGAEKPTGEESQARRAFSASGEINTLSAEQRQSRLDQAAHVGRDPGMHLKGEEMQLAHRIGQLKKDQARVREGHGNAMIIAESPAEYKAKKQNESRNIEDRVAELQEDIDSLDRRRTRFSTITAALESGDVHPAREELGREIDTVEASIMQTDRNIALAESGAIKGDAGSFEAQKHKLEDRRDRLRKMIENLYLYRK